MHQNWVNYVFIFITPVTKSLILPFENKLYAEIMQK